MKNSKLLLTSLLAAAAMGTSAYAGFVWNGGETITQELWRTQSSWTLTDGTTWSTGGTGPLTPNSDRWDPTTVADASGTISGLEGWNLRLTLTNASLEIGTLKKFQGGLCAINLDAGSVLTINQYGVGDGNDGGSTTLNIEGVFNLTYNKNQGGDGFVANLGNGGVMNFTSTGNAFTTKVSTLNATLDTANFYTCTVDAEGNTLYTRRLITLGYNVSFDDTETIVTMTAGEGVGTLTSVENISSADVGSYQVTKDASGYSVSYLVSGSDAIYRWQASGDPSVWSAAVWTKGEATGQNITSDGIAYFGAGDGLASTVTIDAATTVGRLIVDADYTFNGSNYLAMTSGGVVNAGATLILEKSGDGNGGFLRGEIEVAGTLQLNNKDVTGWSNTAGNNLRAITVDVGGVLKLNHGENETFLGTLNLNGTLSGKDANTRWDMYGGNSEIVVAAGANALIDENVKLVICRNDAPIFVGKDATLTIDGQVLKSSVVQQGLGGNGVLVKNGAGTLTLNGTVDVTGLTVSGGKVAVGAAAGASVSGTVEMGTATLDGGTAGITASTLRFGYADGVNTATIQGKVNVTGNLQESSSGVTNGEVLSIAAGASLSVGGTFGTTAANADDSKQHTYTVNVGAGASLSAGTIAHGDSLTVNIGGENASVSATTLVLNSYWDNKTHAFFGQGADVSILSVGTINLNNKTGKTTTFAVSNARLEVGAGGIVGNSSTPVSLSSVTLGVLDGVIGWSSGVAMTFSGVNSADVGENKKITLSGTLSVNGTIEKIGAGTLELAGTVNVGEGGSITVSAGTLVAGNAGALGAGNVVVAGGASLKRGVESDAVAIGGTLTTNGAAMLDFGAASTETAAIAVQGNVTLDESTNFSVDSVSTGLKLISSASTLSVGSVSSGTVSALGISNLYVGGFLANQRDDASATFSVTGGVLTLDSCTVGTTNYSLSWKGGAEGTWKANGSGWQTVADSPAAETFQTGDTVTFTDVSAGAVTVDGNISVAAMTIDSTSNYTFTAGQNGAAIAGTGALTKRGTGTATIDASVDLSGFTGGIEIAQNGGKLMMDTASGYAGTVTAGENGTFTLNVSSDTTLANTLSGAGTFEKTGAGTLTVSTANANLKGQFVISEGTVKLGSAGSDLFGGQSDTEDYKDRYAVQVSSGGTLDMNGKNDISYRVTLSGGSLVNNGNDIDESKRQLYGIQLTADSEIGGSNKFGLLASMYAESNLDLGAHTLTKTGSNVFMLVSTVVTGTGTIDVQAGSLWLANGDESGEVFSMDSGATIKLNGGTITAGSRSTTNAPSVALGNVAIVFNDKNKDAERIKADPGVSFNAAGATLYLDIGALTEATLTPGEDVSLTIAASSAIFNSFFSAVEVGTYGEDGSWVKDLQWAYVEGSWDIGAGTLSIAIPEPSVFGLLAGLGALALAGTRRRRRKA